MVADINGHALTEDGKAKITDNELYRCVKCGKKATSKKAFEKMGECKGE